MKFRLRAENKELDVMKQICEVRGVDYNSLDSFLFPSEEYIRPPHLYTNVVKVSERIINAVEKNYTIGLLVDSDTDGYCCAALTYLFLTDEMGLPKEKILPIFHKEKEHGLTEFIMAIIDKLELDMIILPDSSSNDTNQQRQLVEKGIEVIIIDHHEIEHNENTGALMVNNQQDSELNKSLCGAGMVLKVLEQIDIIQGKIRTKNYHDLVATALVGDCMEMKDFETRHYVMSGLHNINNKLLDELFKANGERSIKTIAFEISPTLNAFIRVGTMEERLDLFGALVGEKGTREINLRGLGQVELSLEQYIAKLGSRIKSRQTTAINKALTSEETVVIEENMPFGMCILCNGTEKSLTGLIGNRLTEVYKKPFIVVKKVGDTYKGSGRTIDTFENFKDFCNESGVFEYALGHQGAFGVGFKNADDIIEKFKGKALDQDLAHIVDKAYIDNVSAYDIMEIHKYKKFWGRGFEEPLVYVKLTDLKPTDIEVIGAKKDTIRIKHRNITYIKFKCPKEEIDNLLNMAVNEVELIGTCNVNEWNNNLYPQIFIEQLELKGNTVELTPKGFVFGGINLTW